MELQFQYHLVANNELLDTDVRDLEVVKTSSGTFLYAATGQGGGVAAYQLSAAGASATLHGTTFYSGAVTGSTIGELQTVTINGVEQLLVGGTETGGLAGYRLYQTGQLGNSSITQISNSAGDPSEVETFTTSDLQAVYTVSEGGGLLRTYSVNDNGGFTARLPSNDDRPDFVMQGEAILRTASVGDREFLIASDTQGDAISSFRITDPNTGVLDPRDEIGAQDGLGIDTPNVMQTVTAFGATYVLVGAAGSSSLSVLRLFYDGHMEATDHILDTANTRFANISALEVVEVDGQVLVIAGGGDDGLSLLTLLPDGQLLHLQSIENDGQNGLDNIASIEVAHVGDTLQVFVAASNTAGLMQFSVDVSDMGEVIRDTSSGSTYQMGTQGNDLLVGAGGNDTLNGGQGDDILVSGYGDGQLQGGAGRDIFVIRPGDGDIRITDFNPDLDRLDLGHLPMLRSVGQLDVSPTGNGLRIDYGSLRIIVNSHDGGPLSASDVFPHPLGSLGSPDRALLLSSPYDPSIPEPTDPDPSVGGNPDPDPDPDTEGPNANPDPDPVVPGKAFTGGAGSQFFRGSAGGDTVDARGGNDRVYAMEGDDIVWAGGGHDVVTGGDGQDRLVGGAGRDSMYGGAGNDSLEGNDGNDEIFGSFGDDVVEGAAGADIMGGSRGDDTLRGGDGADRIFASWDNDLVGGGNGNDEIWGGAGSDTLWGDGGADTLGAGSGDDFIRAGQGNDQIVAGFGDDKAWGDAGADTMRGMDGDDTMSGGNGDDVLIGGSGRDRLWGEGDNDTIRGGGDNDVIGGDAGDDDLWGNHGADQFVFRSGHGNDRIMDFETDQDLIRIEIGNTNYSQLEMRNVNGNAVIDTGPGTVTLVGVRYQELDSDDFLFG